MSRPLAFSLVVLALLSLLGLQAQPPLPPGHPPTNPQLPPGHPPMNPMPPGHPPVGSGPQHPQVAAPPVAADPADVGTIDGIIAAYYGSISGPSNQQRDWGRFGSLFMDGARLVTLRPAGDGEAPYAIDAAQFGAMNDSYFKSLGYFESEAQRRTDRAGSIAHVFSDYEARRRSESGEPYSRGVNGFQLLWNGQRWWIVSLTWDRERPEVEQATSGSGQ